jgi:hypothetical protein
MASGGSSGGVKLDSGQLLTNALISKYFGTNANDYFYVELVAKRPEPADFQGNQEGITVAGKEPKLEANFKIIYNRDSYSVDHGHEWGEGGWGWSIKKGIEGATPLNTGQINNIISSIGSLSSGNGELIDERNQFGNLDVPQVYNGSNQRNMQIQFILLRDSGMQNIVETVNKIRDLTYPQAKKKDGGGDATGFGGGLSFAGSFRYGTPPCIWQVKCSNGAQGLKKAGCVGMNIEYFGPWVGEKGLPTYATVTMNFRSLYENTFDTDFLGADGFSV